MKNVLEAESIICGFGNRLILTDVYLKCCTGEVVGILGRNGSGKSSLLKIIFGTLKAESRIIRINGKNINSPFPQGRLIRYLPQHSFLPPSYKLRALVKYLVASPDGQQKIFQDLHISRHLNKKARELSGGERRYFEVLLLLNSGAQFVLLDEPFMGIEPLYKEKIKELIREYRLEKGIIITDHDYRNVLDVCGSIKLIVNGVCRHLKEAEELEVWGYVPEGAFGNR